MAVCYVSAAVLCLAVPYTTGSRAMARAFTPYTSGPFALASAALALEVVLRSRHGWAEWLTVASWCAAAIAFSAQLMAPPLGLEDVFVLMRVRTVLAVLGAAGMLIATLRSARDRMHVAGALRTLALVGLACLLAWFGIMGLGIIPAGGINQVAAGLRITQCVLTGCAVLLAVTTIGSAEVAQKWGRRPTRG
jgi:hypothetical protein